MSKLNELYPYTVVFLTMSGSSTPAFEWCLETFGNNTTVDNEWRLQVGLTRDVFLFRNEEDFMLFKLRWL